MEPFPLTPTLSPRRGGRGQGEGDDMKVDGARIRAEFEWRWIMLRSLCERAHPGLLSGKCPWCGELILAGRVYALFPRLDINLQPGKKVRILEGSYTGLLGVIERVRETEGVVRVAISVGNELRSIEIDHWLVDVLDSSA